MKILKVSFVTFLLLATIQWASAAYPVVECSSDSVFTENSCNECFDGGAVSAGDNIGLLTDDLKNKKTGNIIVYKEEQTMPKMLPLGSSASWSQTPSEDGFWDYTEAFNALYSDGEDGYIIPASSELTWLESKLGYAYTLDSNTAVEGSNIGLLLYRLISHDISSDGDITIDGETHNECVLFTSGEPGKETPKKPEPPKLPETGPEHILLIVLALILGFGLLRFTKRV